jgi:hypothetical protein
MNARTTGTFKGSASDTALFGFLREKRGRALSLSSDEVAELQTAAGLSLP